MRKCGVDHYMRYMGNFTLLASSKRKLRNAMILKTVGATHTGLSDHLVFVEYTDDEIASFYNTITV